MITIPIQADVKCTDGFAGKSTAIIINPIDQKLTHFVIDDQTGASAVERLVPIDLVSKTTRELILLNCSRSAVKELETFSEMHFIKNEEESVEYLEPFITPLDLQYTTIETERIPPGEMAIRRGSQIEATDGHIGQVGEFLIDPQSDHITHLVLQKGHFWGKKEVTLPITTIDRIGQKTVYLNLSKAELAELPTIPVSRVRGVGEEIELMIWTFTGAQTAGQALDNLKKLTKSKQINLLNSAIVLKDNQGHTSVEEAQDLDTRHGAFFGAVTGGLIGLLGGPVGVVLGAAAGAVTGGAAAHWIDMGFDNERLKSFRDNLQPDTSALILLVHKADLEQVTGTLDDFKGEWMQQSVTDDMVSQILSTHEEETDQEI